MSSGRTSLAILALATLVSAHVQINYPLGEWEIEETTQETGAVCGGGTRGSAPAFGALNSFISLSGDEGQQITVMWATSNSTSDPVNVQGTSTFSDTLVSSATFPSSGNFCVNVTIPGLANLVSGTRATFYVQASGEGKNVSSCADVVVIPTLDVNQTPVVSSDGQQVLNPASGSVVSVYDYYCSNSTILALDTCDCHCHDSSEHCSSDCSVDRIAAAKAQCALGTASGSSSVLASSAAVVTASARPSSAASTHASSVSVAGPSASVVPSSSAAKKIGSISLAVVAGVVALAL